jgi:Transglutaminase-like superfamily
MQAGLEFPCKRRSRLFLNVERQSNFCFAQKRELGVGRGPTYFVRPEAFGPLWVQLLMWNWIRQFRMLERPGRGLFLRMSILLPLVSVSLPARGFRNTKAFPERLLPPAEGSSKPDVQARAAFVAEVVRAAAQTGLGRPTCLVQSLVLWWFLARQGIASDLRIGIRRQEGNFEAHAWIESGGVILYDPDEVREHFAAFDASLASLPAELRPDRKVTD